MNPIYLQALSFQDRFGPGEDCIHSAADMATELGIAGIDIEDPVSYTHLTLPTICSV